MINTARIRDWEEVDAGPGKVIQRLTIDGVRGTVDLVFSEFISIDPRTKERAMKKAVSVVHHSTLPV